MRTPNNAAPQLSPDQLSPAEPSPAELPFEDALRELDAVVAQLEAGRISLEESLQLMQRGVALADACDTTLSRVEATLEQLVMTEDGELVAHRLQWEDDEDEDADVEDANVEDANDE